ncbi:unnamed protein product [Cylindrotheca closterium]|uniref:FAD-binding FR-type domain-containing protein n=1 Tax=Cylindrotheca closterium TaxID=2856 RepID=A0AAD2FYL1_9STRA|nr:unnamed protein product [Cylindrotheca closterium]
MTTTNNTPPESVSHPAYLTHMSMEQEGSESQSLMANTYARTYSSMEDDDDDDINYDDSSSSSHATDVNRAPHQNQKSSSSSSSSSPSALGNTRLLESIHEQMHREMNRHSATTNNSHNYFGWLFPKKKKRKTRQRRANHRNYSDQEQEQFLAEMSRSNDGSHHHHNSPSMYRKTNIVGWLWGFFLLLTLGWVCVFTLSEGHIDWAEVINYEPQHQTPALQQKEGIRLVSFFGIGYLLPGIVSLLCLFVGLRLPFIQKPALSKLIQLPRYGTTYWSMMDLQLLLLFVIVLVGSFIVRFWHKYVWTDGPHWTLSTSWRYITKISGMSLVTILLVILFPICKTCFWWDVFGLGFDRIIKFHRLLGALFGIILLLHGLASLVYLDMVDQLYSCWTPWSNDCEKSMVMYGWYSGILFIPVFLTSFPWIRRNRYEVFYYCHLMVIPALLMAHLHHINLIYYTAPSLVAYTLDKIVGYFAARRPVQLVDLSVPVEGYTRMTLLVDPNHADFSPGQWIKVKVPAISNWEWHPFSITSAPNQSTITLDIKAMGGVGSWGDKLQHLAKSVSAGSVYDAHQSRRCPTKPDDPQKNKLLPTVYLDRYQGCDHNQGFLNHRAVMLVGGGIGITPMMSVLRSCLAATATEDGGGPPLPSSMNHLEHLVFVWVVRQESVVDLYRDELQRYQALGGFYRNGKNCKLDILVYVTGKLAGCGTNEPIVDPPPPLMVSTNGGSDKEMMLTKEVVVGSKSAPAPGPFSKTILGHMHHALLMIAVGFGFLRGFVSGSSFADRHEWRQELAVLLQVALGLLFSSILGTIVILGGTLVWKPRTKKSRRGNHVGGTTVMDPENQQARDEYPPLEIHRGERPNVPQIVAELKQQCLQSGIPSVGVSVCGPEKLTKSVLTSVYEASSPLLEFVMGEESFEW